MSKEVAIARSIMEKLGIKESIIEDVCNIIGNHHSPGKIDTLNFKTRKNSQG